MNVGFERNGIFQDEKLKNNAHLPSGLHPSIVSDIIFNAESIGDRLQSQITNRY